VRSVEKYGLIFAKNVIIIQHEPAKKLRQNGQQVTVKENNFRTNKLSF